MKLFQRTQRSLFGEILDWMLTPLLLLWPISLALTWLVAQNLANKPFDRALVDNTQALAQYLSVGPDHRLQFAFPQAAGELLRADDADNVYYQVLGPGGAFVSGARALPHPPEAPATDAGAPAAEPQLRDAEYQGVPVRVAALWVPVEGLAGPALVQVAETREKRSVLAAEIIKGVMLPQFAILPLAVLLVWLALVRGIRPLSELERRIRGRRPDDLSPLDESAVPQEVGPLVDSVNELLTRLKDSIATQKRFLADAAHQLKTPLAGLRMQADLAQRADASEADLKQSLQQIGRASMRATHTVNQLLALARAESGSTELARQPCDLAAITRDAVQEAVPRALRQRIDLGYDGPPPGTPGTVLTGNATLLHELVRNLVDNALKYTPSEPAQPGVVTVRLRIGGLHDARVLQVEDNGPGIPAAERAHVLQPFYRVLGSAVDGSGLGLSIVDEIARQHRATVAVDDAHPGQQPPGACFTVRFPSPADTG
ncbi:MAG: sensor histidine kinase N-terminal domain-containing protein [Burkholderiales bacterium]|nr:sensor histidine kinase N-terminal domain-containing protein [Burkholderiales bacterium]MBS0414099.1 sensor histidine kinase N-terminal domain-containing protein [Pseudomonadota bacterium]